MHVSVQATRSVCCSVFFFLMPLRPSPARLLYLLFCGLLFWPRIKRPCSPHCCGNSLLLLQPQKHTDSQKVKDARTVHQHTVPAAVCLTLLLLTRHSGSVSQLLVDQTKDMAAKPKIQADACMSITINTDCVLCCPYFWGQKEKKVLRILLDFFSHLGLSKPRFLLAEEIPGYSLAWDEEWAIK